MMAAQRVPRTAAFLIVAILGAACGDGAESDSERRARVPNLRGPELVPQELVAALLTGLVTPGPTVPEIVVGRLPDNLPFEVPRPENARVVGALAGPSVGTLVFAVAVRPLDAMRSYRELLRRTGWDDPGRELGSGFQPSEIIHSGPFCQGEERSITTRAAVRSDGQTLLQVRYAKNGRYSPCDDRQRENMSSPRGPMPTLYPPRDASILDGSVGGGRNYMEASGRLKTELRPAQLVAHYGAQLRADGWTPQSEASGADVVGQTWRIQDRRGQAWVGVLMAIAIPDSEDRQMLFRVMPPESNPSPRRP
jgi:hypothetical protein